MYRIKHHQEKLVVGAFALLTLVSFIFLVVKIHDYIKVRPAATSTNGVNLTLPATLAAAPGQDIFLPVTLTSSVESIRGTDLVIDFDNTYLRLVDIVPDALTTSPLKTAIPLDASGNFDSARVVTTANSTGKVEFGLVTYDSSSQQVTQASTISDLKLATLHFVGLQVGSTTINLEVDPTTVSTIDTNVVSSAATPADLLISASQITNTSLVLAYPTPTPTPTLTPTPSPTSTPAPTPTPVPFGLSFEAEAGTLTAPMSSNGTYISQATSPNLTNPSVNGKASYLFTVPQSGNYKISALVNTPASATTLKTDSNSFFINIDAEPTSPTMIWDVNPVTSGFQTRDVAWRGTSTNPDADAINPKIFNLSAGVLHTLIIRGREANTQLDQIQLVAIIPTSAPSPTPTRTPTPTPTPVVSISPVEAESGTLTAPMVSSGSYISQPTNNANLDSPSQGGKAVISFTVPASGNYRISATVNTYSGDSAPLNHNSFFVNVDAEPTGTTMIWDIFPTTSGFQIRNISWKGTSTNPDADAINPKIFTLSAGPHQLIVRGREGNTQLDRIQLVAQ